MNIFNIGIKQTINQFLNNINDLDYKELQNIFKNNLNYNINESKYTDNIKNNILSGNSKLGNITYEKITKEILDNQYTLLDDFMLNFCDVDKFTNILESYHINEYYQMYIRRFKKYDIDIIDFILPNDKKFLNNFINDIINCGFYYNSRELLTKNDKEYDYYNNDIKKILTQLIHIRFLPITQKNIRNIIKNNTNKIYHYTYKENIESIKKEGLKINNISHPTYPKRLFFITNINNFNVDFNNFKNSILNRLKDNYKKLYNKNPEIIEIEIDINDLPNYIKFYIDINSFPYAIYTDKNIKSKYLNIKNNIY